MVAQIGTAVRRFKPGERVWANHQCYDDRQGTSAEYVNVDERLLSPLPPGVDMQEAVAVLHSALTAVVGLFAKARLHAGETMFVNGGSGNVGSAILQFAKASGARVIVTAGSEEKIRWCRELGAALVINYKEIAHPSSVTSDGYGRRSSAYLPMIPLLSTMFSARFPSLLCMIDHFSVFYTRSHPTGCFWCS